MQKRRFAPFPSGRRAFPVATEPTKKNDGQFIYALNGSRFHRNGPQVDGLNRENTPKLRFLDQIELMKYTSGQFTGHVPRSFLTLSRSRMITLYHAAKKNHLIFMVASSQPISGKNGASRRYRPVARFFERRRSPRKKKDGQFIYALNDSRFHRNGHQTWGLMV